MEGLRSKRFDLKTDGLDIRIDALVQKRALHGIELLAAASVLPALERRHLVRELIDLQLLVFEFLVAAGKLRFAYTQLGIARTDCSSCSHWL